ncbi:MAG: hypothetical protein EON48_15190, partial [Acetobacteraceae bacterium]
MTSDLAIRVAACREAFHRDGVVHIPGALDAANQAIAREMFDWSRAHPGQAAWDVALGGPDETVFIDTHNPAARAPYRELLARSAMPEIAAAVLGVDAVWFLGEQIFVKQGAQGTRSTPWHQDSDLPIDATGALAMWMAFEPLDIEAGLKFVRGSHRGPCLNPVMAVDEGGVPQYLYPTAAEMPPFPDIDADPRGYDVVSWAYEPGDLILFHSMTIHGGATVPARGCPQIASVQVYQLNGDDRRAAISASVKRDGSCRAGLGPDGQLGTATTGMALVSLAGVSREVRYTTVTSCLVNALGYHDSLSYDNA